MNERPPIIKHHVLYTRPTWYSMGDTRYLRSIPELVIPMDSEVEEALHLEVTTMPLPDLHTAAVVRRQFQPVKHNPVKSVERLAKTFWEVSNRPNTQYVERQLGKLIVECLNIQLPYIREGYAE